MPLPPPPRLSTTLTTTASTTAAVAAVAATATTAATTAATIVATHAAHAVTDLIAAAQAREGGMNGKLARKANMATGADISE